MNLKVNFSICSLVLSLGIVNSYASNSHNACPKLSQSDHNTFKEFVNAIVKAKESKKIDREKNRIIFVYDNKTWFTEISNADQLKQFNDNYNFEDLTLVQKDSTTTTLMQGRLFTKNKITCHYNISAPKNAGESDLLSFWITTSLEESTGFNIKGAKKTS